MSYPTGLVLQAQQNIDNKKFRNEMITERNYEEIRSKFPEAATITNELAGTIDKLSKLILAHDDKINEKIEALKNENLSLQQKLMDLLVTNGYPKDYLDTKYSCNECNDTGFTQNGRCKCFSSELKRLAASQLSASLNMGLTSFDTFNLEYYNDISLPELKGRSSKAIMKTNYEQCKDFADNFHLPSKGIFMTGGTGLGKTHLSLAIASEVIEHGYSAVYGSVPDLFEKIEAAHFGRSDNNIDVMQSIKECDLLILDDLGAEFESQFYVSCLYDIINSRINMGKPTIISTNLSVSEVKNRYSDRITSRILSMKCLKFVGDDIRLKINNLK